MVKKNICVSLLFLMVTLLLLACSANEDKQVDEDQLQEEYAKEVEEKNSQSHFSVKKVSIETDTRMIEGMEEDVTVVAYELLPFGIAYELDESFGNPNVKNGVIHYERNSSDYSIDLQVKQNATVEEEVETLQEKYESRDFTEVGELETISEDENGFTGKMQYFSDPMTGFYVYDIEDYVFVITYEYPIEAGDGMGPLLHSLRESITLQ